jgi:dUTP pyrophosphatase
MKIKIKYFDETIEKLNKTGKGDWIDLRSRVAIEYKKGDTIKIPLNVAMELPKGYEAVVAPRSSTYKNFGLILTNSLGVIDNAYNGNNDEWSSVWYAISDGKVEKNDRICQFRIQKNMPVFEFDTVLFLDNQNREGFGSSGVK